MKRVVGWILFLSPLIVATAIILHFAIRDGILDEMIAGMFMVIGFVGLMLLGSHLIND